MPGQQFGNTQYRTSLHPVLVIKTVAETGTRQVCRYRAEPDDGCVRNLRLPQYLAAHVIKPPELEMVCTLTEHKQALRAPDDSEAPYVFDSDRHRIRGSQKRACYKDGSVVLRRFKCQTAIAKLPLGNSANGPLPACIQTGPAEVIREGELPRVEVCRSSAWSGTPIDDRPCVGPCDSVEHRFAANVDGPCSGIGVIDKVVFAGWSFDGRSMTRALPVGIRSDDGVGRILHPWAEQMIGTCNALGIMACSSAACISCIEKIEVTVMPHDVWSFDDATLPG